jgi:predicted O-methyltransferase YrrM
MNNKLTNEILAINLLKNIMPANSYLPYSSSSLSFDAIRVIANDVIMHGRRSILEFGTGISTILLGKLLDISGGGLLVSVDENSDWCQIMNEIIQLERVESVQIVHAPIASTGDYQGWYDVSVLDSEIQNEFNLVLVDGPSAWQKGREKSRKAALNFFQITN